MDRAAIRWVALKGPVLSSVWYRDPAARVYYDLDILVDPDCLSRAIDAVATEGFTEYNRNWAGFRSLGLGEVPLGDGTVTLDLHWHLLTFEKDRRVFTFPTSDVLDRRVRVSLGSVSAWSLAADDTVCHIVLHAGLAGARLLVHLRDVQVVASSVDWGAALTRMREIGIDRLASATINRVERLFGPLGDEARAPSLHHRAWQATNLGLDVAWSAVNTNQAKPYLSGLLASGRPSVTFTVTESARQVITSVRRHTGLRTLTSPGGPLTWDHDAGGLGERDRFLRDVESGYHPELS